MTLFCLNMKDGVGAGNMDCLCRMGWLHRFVMWLYVAHLFCQNRRSCYECGIMFA